MNTLWHLVSAMTYESTDSTILWDVDALRYPWLTDEYDPRFPQVLAACQTRSHRRAARGRPDLFIGDTGGASV